MIRQNADPSAGGVVYWSTSTTKREDLKRWLDHLGMGEMMPAERTDAAALKAALASYCVERKKNDKENNQIVELAVQAHKDQGKHGYDVATVRRGVERNSTTQQFGAKVTAGVVEITHGYCDDSRALQRSYQHFKTELSGSAVSGFLVKAVGMLNGVTLRANGGVYWMPAASIEKWEMIAKAVETAGGYNDEKRLVNQCYLLRTPMDAQTFRAVRDAISAEIMAESQAIADEITGGQIGEEALENRKEKLAGLVDRVEAYEGILGDEQALVQVRGALDVVRASIAMTVLAMA